jgi:hypothetical protein
MEQLRQRSSLFARRPRVYFEEWDDPMITGIRWVSVKRRDFVIPRTRLCHSVAQRTGFDFESCASH